MNSGFLAKLIILAGIFLLLPLAQASAATITVGATCTFKQAWDSAFDDSAPTGSGCTAGSGADTIELTGDVTMVGKIWESGGGTLTINGNGHALRGDGSFAFFGLWGAPTITFNNITFTGAAGGDRESGAAFNPYTGSGTYTFNDCVFHNNKALKLVGGSGGQGGAITTGQATTLTINRCAFYNNRAKGEGGAIYAEGVLNISNSSFYNNSSEKAGGAIYLPNSPADKNVRLRHVTITNNQAGATRGALGMLRGDPVQVLNSIIYGNSPVDCRRPDQRDDASLDGTTLNAYRLSSNAGSIIGTSNCDFVSGAAGNAAATDNPQLAGPFGSFYIPRAGSPAINAVACLAANVGGNIDQRGNSRPIGSQCDRGAIEHAGYIAPTQIPAPPPPGSDFGGPGGSSGSASRSGSQGVAQPAAVPVIRYSPAQSCQTLQPDIVVSKASIGTSCQRVEGSEIGHPDVIAAMPSLVVDIWGWVTPGTQVCFLADSGSIKFIDTTAIPRTVADLPVFSEAGGLLCATVDGAGQVALVAGPSAPAPQQQAASAQGRSLSNCMVLLQYSLNFRDAPDGKKIGALRSQIKLTALERTDGWFKVDYHGEQGWISAAYVEPEGDCG